MSEQSARQERIDREAEHTAFREAMSEGHTMSETRTTQIIQEFEADRLSNGHGVAVRNLAVALERAERSEPAAASVPQGGEFTAAEVERMASDADEAAGDGQDGGSHQFHVTAQMLRAYARALSSAPGEREGR